MATFSELGLRPEILAALTKLGFITPHTLNSRQDLIALAQTGTGKTAAFGLPVLSKIDETLKRPQALILCPTRELCLQISKDIKAFVSELPALKVAAIYGGDSYVTQSNALFAGPQIIVGTPGRTLDMVKRGTLKLDTISWLILDEADEMLKMGFKEELDAILETSPKDKQTLLFSATMDRTVDRIARDYMKNPLEITTSIRNQGSATINHEYYMVQAKDKYETLKRILDVNPDIYGIIFCNTRLETQHIAAKLMEEKYTAAPISGELSQGQREQVMAAFRNRQIQILVATDVAARGIDVKELSHVIHYGLPTKTDHYTHRSGRTGRAGSTGTSIAIIHMREKYMVKMIENKTGIIFKNKMIPTAKDICSAQLLHVVEKITSAPTGTVDMSEYMPVIEEKLSHLTREELIHQLVSVELGRFINFYKNLPDIHTSVVAEPRPSPYKNKLFEQRPYSAENMTRMRINIGKRSGFSVPKLFEVVNSQKNIKGIQIGDIRLEGDHTLLEIDKSRTTMFMNALNGKNINGVSLRVEPAGDAPPVRVSADIIPATPKQSSSPIYKPTAPGIKIFTERVRGKKPGKKKY
jgi:ATP-dependent RNA helicase DeaD